MVYVTLLVVLFLSLASVSLFDKDKDKLVISIYVTAVAMMVLLAAFKPIGIDADSLTYLDHYNGSTKVDIEYSCLLICDIARDVFQSPQFIFVIYALLAIPIKAYGTTRMTDLWFVSLLVWLSNYFILHDLTQIRAAVSAGIFIYSLYFLQHGERLKYLLCITIACFFHLSAILLFFLVFLGNKPLSRTWKILLAVVPMLGYLLAFFKIDLIVYVPIPYIQERVEIYEEARDIAQSVMDEINIFNAVYLIRVLMYYLLLWKGDIISQHVKNYPLLIKIFSLSIICYTAFSFLPVLAFRTSELLGVVEILLIPYLAYSVRPLSVGKGLIIGYATGLMLLNLFYNELLELT